MKPIIPSCLIPPAASLQGSHGHGQAASLFGYYPDSEHRPYLYLSACFQVKAKYPYRFTLPAGQETWDPTLCFLYTENGQGSVTSGQGESFTLAQQHLYLWPCEPGFSLRAVSSHWNHFFLFISGEETKYFYRLFFNQGNRPWLVPASSRLPSLLSGLTRKDAAAYASPLQQIFLATGIMTEALSVCREQAEETFCPDYLLAIRRMMDEEYALPCSLDLLEKRFQVSKFRIAREFSQYFHQAPISYLTKRRLEAAKNLLVTTDDKIHEISAKTGFGSPNLLIRSFKKEFGVTPQVYRKENSKIRL